MLVGHIDVLLRYRTTGRVHVDRFRTFIESVSHERGVTCSESWGVGPGRITTMNATATESQ